MKKQASSAAPTKRTPMIHMCCDRILTGAEKIRAMQAALTENPHNAPPPPTGKKLMGVSSLAAPAKMALQTGKKWADGKTLGVCFLDGSAKQKARVTAQAVKWSQFANIKFNFLASKSSAQIRISFRADDGSWSYIGTDCLGIAKTKPTMNFGWLKDDTDDTEYERVVVEVVRQI